LNMDKKGADVLHYKILKMDCPDGVIDPVRAKKLLDVFYEELKYWEKYLSESDYLAGNKLSLADLTAFPNLALFVRCGLDLAKHAPHVNEYYKRLVHLPSIQKTWPPHWVQNPIGPKEVFE